MRTLTVLMMPLLFTSAAGAQCPNGLCPVPSVSAPPVAHGWYDAGDGKLTLYWKGELIGTLQPTTSDWHTNGKPASVNLRRTFNLGHAQPASCPCAKGQCACVDSNCAGDVWPAVLKRDEQPQPPLTMSRSNFGVNCDRLRKDGKECFTMGGAEVPERQAYAALVGDANVPDDAKTPRLVVLGSATGRRKVLDDWSTSTALAPFKDKAIVQAYPPDHWHVAEVGYRQVGDPTIYLVDAKGKVVTWQSDYDGGPQRLAKTMTEGLRVADPAFDPSKSPDLSRTPSPKQPDAVGTTPLLTPNQMGAGGLLALASIAGTLLYSRKKS